MKVLKILHFNDHAQTPSPLTVMFARFVPTVGAQDHPSHWSNFHSIHLIKSPGKWPQPWPHPLKYELWSLLTSHRFLVHTQWQIIAFQHAGKFSQVNTTARNGFLSKPHHFSFTYPPHKLMCLGVQRTPFQAIRWLMITFSTDIKEMKASTGII